MATASIVGNGVGDDSLSIERASVAKEKSQRAIMLSSKVRSYRNLMITTPYQLGSSHASSHYQQLVEETTDIDDSINDIDDTEVDLDDDADEFAHDAPLLQLPQEKTPNNKCSPKLQSPGSPASVLSGHETVFRSLEGEQEQEENDDEPEEFVEPDSPRDSETRSVATNKSRSSTASSSSRRKSSKTSAGSGNISRGSSRRKVGSKSSKSETGGLTKARKAAQPEAEELDRENENQDGSGRRRSSQAAAVEEDSDGSTCKASPTKRRPEKRGINNTGAKKLSRQPTPEALGYENNADATSSSHHTKRRQERRSSNPGLRKSSHHRPTAEDLGYENTDAATSSHQRRRQERRSSNGLRKTSQHQPTAEDLGYENTDATASTHARRRRERRASNGAKPSRVQRQRSKSSVSDLEASDLDGDEPGEQPRERRAGRRPRRPSTDLGNANGKTDTTTTSTSRRKLLTRRSSTGTLSSDDDVMVPENPGRRRAARRRKSTGVSPAADCEEDNSNNICKSEDNNNNNSKEGREETKAADEDGSKVSKRDARRSSLLSRANSTGRGVDKASQDNKNPSKPRRSKSERTIDDKEADSQGKASTKPASGSKDLKTSRNERKDAVHKNRSRFVSQKSFKVTPINRRSKSLRNLMGEGSSSSDFMKLDGSHSGSGSISSVTISTGIVSKDDLSVSSKGPESFRRSKTTTCATREPTAPERRAQALSRWHSNPQNSPNTSSDGIPSRPDQDLTSLCSPKATLPGKQGTATADMATRATAAHLVAPVRQASRVSAFGPMSSSMNSKNSTNSKRSSLSEKDKQFHSSNPSHKGRIYPEILIPAASCRSSAGRVSALTTPDCLSQGTGSSKSSSVSSLQSKLQMLSGEMTPMTSKPKFGLAEPDTPAQSIGVSDLGTPVSMTHGGYVSELTFASGSSGMSSSLQSSSQDHSRRRALDTFMTNVQSVMLHEGEYNRDATPRVVRRHSLDSVSYVDEPGSRPSTHSKESDNAPRVPSRQRSVSSILM